MAKTGTAEHQVQETRETHVPATKNSQFTEEMPEGLAPGQRTGISDRPEDNLIPMILVLQPLSPQLDPAKTDKFIPGATAGMIILRNSQGSGMVPGEVGFNFQMVDYRPVWIEWVDREKGGGFVARYADKDGRPDFPPAKKHPQDKFSYVNPANGNRITNHHNHVGYVLAESGEPLPALISFKGAGISESRSWMTMLPRTRSDGGDADACDFAWHMVAVAKSNTKGRWFDIRAKKRLGYVKPEQQAMGRQLAEQFRLGEVQADMSEAGEQQAADDSSAM